MRVEEEQAQESQDFPSRKQTDFLNRKNIGIFNNF